jgi:hypothetical protein
LRIVSLSRSEKSPSLQHAHVIRYFDGKSSDVNDSSIDVGAAIYSSSSLLTNSLMLPPRHSPLSMDRSS